MCRLISTWLLCCCCPVTKSCLTLQSHGLQHTRLLCPPQFPAVCSNSCPLSQWCHLTISSSATPSPFAFSLSQHQGLFQCVSSLHLVAKQLDFSISPSNEFPLGLTGLISLQIKGLLRVFSSITIQKHQFFSAQPYLRSNSHICTRYWKNHSFDHTDLCQKSDVSTL